MTRMTGEFSSTATTANELVLSAMRRQTSKTAASEQQDVGGGGGDDDEAQQTEQKHQRQLPVTFTSKSKMSTSWSPSLLIVMNLLFIVGAPPATNWLPRRQPQMETGTGAILFAEAISVQRLNVPDLVVIDQQNLHNQIRQPQQQAIDGSPHLPTTRTQLAGGTNQPEAASLINDLTNANGGLDAGAQAQVTFECLISYDRKKDRNLIIKWHHDDRVEPIYQWILELNKRSIAPQYRAYIAPIILPPSQQSADGTTSANQTQLLEAGFKLVRPTKELGGKYTCSAISSQNDDSKWKKMIVYTPPRSFRFNASRTDIGAQLASQRDRLIQLSGQQQQQPLATSHLSAASSSSSYSQLTLAYRMRGLDGQQLLSTSTIPPPSSLQHDHRVDYVNVRSRQSSGQSSPVVQASSSPSSWHISPPTPSPFPSQPSSSSSLQQTDLSRRQSFSPTRLLSPQAQSPMAPPYHHHQNGVKLVCDIDQVFPVPEVSIYRLAKLDGSHPDKLAKLDTKIERDSITGLYHVQVTSILDDDELQMKYGLNEPVYFECLIALTNLELSKYADNKRSIVYKPGLLTSNHLTNEDISSDLIAGNGAATSAAHLNSKIFVSLILASWLIYYTSRRKL